MATQRCWAEVWNGSTWYPCSRKGKNLEGGKWWCTQHTPSFVKAKTKTTYAALKQRLAARERAEEATARTQRQNERRLALYPQLVEALRKLVSQCESMGRASHTNAVIEAANAALAAANRAEKGDA